MQNFYYVYILIDTTTETHRYVGSTQNLSARLALGMWLEKLSLSEVEIKMKASIVPEDGPKRSKIGRPYVGLIMEIFEEVQVQNKKKNIRKLFSVKKGIRDKDNREFTLKIIG